MTGQNFGESVCLWSGPLFVLLFAAGILLFAGWLPPPGPSLSAEEVAAMIRQDTLSIRVGVAAVLLSMGLIIAFSALVSAEMRRITGCSQALVNTQMLCGAAVAAVGAVTGFLWAAAVFRPDRDPAMTLMIHDMAWLSLLATVSAPALQPAAVGLAILGDPSDRPRYPRWAGFLNLWIAVLLIPGVLSLFFKRGPFAWDGLFVFYIPFVVFGAWFLVMFYLMRSRLGVDSS